MRRISLTHNSNADIEPEQTVFWCPLVNLFMVSRRNEGNGGYTNEEDDGGRSMGNTQWSQSEEQRLLAWKLQTRHCQIVL